MKVTFGSILIAVALMVSAPVHAQDTSAPAKPAADAPSDKVGPPPADKGQVVFFRKGRLAGALDVFTVRENGEKIGKLGNGTYFVLTESPGIHSFTAHTEGTDSLRIEVDPGETYYVECLISVGLMLYKANLELSDQPRFSAVSNHLHLKTLDEPAKDPSH